MTGLGQAASITLQQAHKLLETFPSLRPTAFSSGRAQDLAREAPFIEEVYAFNSLSLSKPVVQQDLGAVNNAVWLRDFHCSAAAGSGPTGLCPALLGCPLPEAFVFKPYPYCFSPSSHPTPPGMNFKPYRRNWCPERDRIAQGHTAHKRPNWIDKKAQCIKVIAIEAEDLCLIPA